MSFEVEGGYQIPAPPTEIVSFAVPTLFITGGIMIMNGTADLHDRYDDFTGKQIFSIREGYINNFTVIGIALYIAGWIFFLAQLYKEFGAGKFEAVIILAAILIPACGINVYCDVTACFSNSHTLWWMSLFGYIVGWFVLASAFSQIFVSYRSFDAYVVAVLAIIGCILLVQKRYRWCFMAQLGQVVYYFAWVLFIFLLTFYQERRFFPTVDGELQEFE